MPRKARTTSRAKERARLVEQAARVALPSEVDVCVVGGGAAGLVAAIVAAKNGARTVVLERDLICGRTILATGNGRCNMANTNLDPQVYNDPAFVQTVCGRTWLEDIRAFFYDCGLVWREESQGRLYPLSLQAASVREVLIERAKRAGVVLAPLRAVSNITNTSNDFTIAYSEDLGSPADKSLRAMRVILATGGAVAATCAHNLGFRAEPLQGLLCPLECQGADFAGLDGRRVHALVRVLRDGREITREAGEVLFRSYGVSGIVIFNLSRHAEPGDTLALDLLPELSLDAARKLSTHTLAGILDPQVAEVLARQAGDPADAVLLAKNLHLRVTGLRREDGAQVHRGGFLCDQFHTQTLESKQRNGFYACGETLDVDGPCGGFNLAWAWKSGMVAGKAAACANTASKGARS